MGELGFVLIGIVIGILVALVFFLLFPRLRKPPPAAPTDDATDRVLYDATTLPAQMVRLTKRQRQWQGLSDREMDIAVLVAQGLTNIQVAHRLGLSPRTVGAYLQRIYAKLEVHSRVEMTNAIRDFVDLANDPPT